MSRIYVFAATCDRHHTSTSGLGHRSITCAAAWVCDVSIAHSCWWVFNMGRESFGGFAYAPEHHHHHRNHHHLHRRQTSVRFPIRAVRCVKSNSVDRRKRIHIMISGYGYLITIAWKQLQNKRSPSDDNLLCYNFNHSRCGDASISFDWNYCFPFLLPQLEEFPLPVKEISYARIERAQPK